MTAEHILDAMNELPDHLLTQADAVRKRKPFRWQLLATAVCLVLTVGIAYSLLLGPTKSAEVAQDNALEDVVKTESQTSSWYAGTVTAAEPEMLAVRLDSGREVKVELSRLAEKPEIMPGQRIRIYLDEDILLTDAPLKPYKIEIEEE